VYQVINTETNEMVEEHSRPESAYRAMMICNAQAIGNGDPPKYRCEPAVFPVPHVSDLNLPNWARKALGI
jgi:hypothetical protein